VTLINVAKRTEKFLADNSPVVLTVFAVTGTITTAYLTGKATFKAADLIKIDEQRRYHYNEDPAEKKEVFLLVWKEYIPAAGVCFGTLGCIITANRIGTRRAAAMAAAYSISEKAFSEYKEKVVEKLGDNKERAIRDEIAQDQVTKNPATGREVLIGRGDILCFDAYTARYFMSSMEEVKKAQNDTNYEILHNNYCSLGDFYNRLGLPGTSFSEEVGWNSDHLLEVVFSTVLADDGQPCLSLRFHVDPIRSYYKSW
jgi:hypothetical protein